MPSSNVNRSGVFSRSNACGPLANDTLTVFHRDSTWVNSPGWPAVKPLPFNAYTMNLWKWDLPMVTIKNPFDTVVCNRTLNGNARTLLGEQGLVRSTWLVADSVAKADASARMKAKDASANWAQILAESGRTYNLAISTLQSLRRAVRGVRTGNLSEIASALALPQRDVRRPSKKDLTKSLAQRWLELQYGWKPLLSDLEKSFNGCLGYLAQNRVLHRVYGKGSARNLQILPWVTGTAVMCQTFSIKEMSSFTTTCFEFGFKSETLNAFSKIGLTNPVSLAWELVPFSFVVDWFLPIGTFLETMDLAVNLDFKRGFRSTIKRQRTVVTYRKSPGWINGREFSASDNETYDMVNFTRGVFTTLPRQPYPRLQNPFSPTRFANALALFAASFK